MFFAALCFAQARRYERRPHHGFIPRSMNRFKPGCHEDRNENPVEMKIIRCDGDRLKRIVETEDLSTIRRFASQYPLINYDELINAGSGKKVYYNYYGDGYHRELDANSFTITKQGDTYEVILEKGHGFADFECKTYWRNVKKCMGKTTHVHDGYNDRGVTAVENQQILEAIKAKIGF